MGEAQGTEGGFNHCPQENDVTSRPSKDRSRSETSLGKVAEGAKGIV
jgi:hypothetical protein